MTSIPAAKWGNYDRAGAGKSINDGMMYKYTCLNPTGVDTGNAYDISYRYVPNGEPVPAAPPPPPPPPNPADVVREFLSDETTLPMPTPEINVGPNLDEVVVHRPVWFWTDMPATASADAGVPRVQVHMTATLDRVDWHTSEPIDNPDEYPGGPTTAISCDGPGEPAPPKHDLYQLPVEEWPTPTCGHTYTWKSSAERTDGARAWNLSAQAHWTLTWTAEVDGVAVPGGSFPLTSDSETVPVTVYEIRTALVAGVDSDGP